MQAKGSLSCGSVSLGRWIGAFALVLSGCGGNDYYFLQEIKGQGDTVVLQFLYTCGELDVTWDGAFVGEKNPYAILAVSHDASGDCDEDPRDFSLDVGPMKRAFRSQHPWPAALGLRVPPYELEQAAVCLTNLFQEEEFDGKRCK